MIGLQNKHKALLNLDKSGHVLSEELNPFYVRFDSCDFTDSWAEFGSALESSQI